MRGRGARAFDQQTIVSAGRRHRRRGTAAHLSGRYHRWAQLVALEDGFGAPGRPEAPPRALPPLPDTPSARTLLSCFGWSAMWCSSS